MKIAKILFLLLVLGLILGFAYFGLTKAPVKQETVTKKVENISLKPQ